ncbi:hypothetical protein A2U01_0021474, partial [Trifolium medium]|nr:hypothetical protein [Trifolium medium]
VEIDLLVLGDSLLFQKIWLRSVAVPDSFLCNLTSLIVEGCGFLSNAIIPSHLLHSLSNLEKLQVRKCNYAKAIFDETKMNNMGPASNPLSFRIKILILEQLPILEHIWNEGPQGILSLPLLEKVIVDGCKGMKYLFPASEVKMDRLETLHVKNCDMLVEIWNEVQKRSLSLPLLEEVIVDGCTGIKSLFPASEVKMVRLKTLHVINCDMLVEIIAKQNIAAEKQNEKIFSSVTSLKLWNLPNLRWMFPGMDILKWPKLEELDILHCQDSFLTKMASLSKVWL